MAAVLDTVPDSHARHSTIATVYGEQNAILFAIINLYVSLPHALLR